MLSRTSGMVLVTGPTGAGKTTTLYAALRSVLARGVTVMSVEDPVEYHMEGVNQISVNHDVGLNFAKALRHILRHDPDALMVGEIRDAETAEIALESAMTGHLVLSTLHTSSAAGAIPRLIDMGVAPYLVASTISGIVAQRLVRLNCTHCLVAEEVAPDIRAALGLNVDERFARGFGCDRCGGTGFVGREVVYELLEMTPALRRAVQSQATGHELQHLAEEAGMQPLTKRVVQLARERRTSLAEAFRLSIN
jgi:type IV pilus assembly protein PilB